MTVNIKNRDPKLCSDAIHDFWDNERELIKQGKGTRDWTPEQQQDILNLKKNGEERKRAGVPKDEKGKAYQGHHMKSAEKYPECQAQGSNIQALSPDEHKDGHDGDFRNPSNGYYNPDTGEKTDYGDLPPPSGIPPIIVLSQPSIKTEKVMSESTPEAATSAPPAATATPEPESTANVIPRDKINVICPYPLYDFYDIEITHEINEHAKMRLKAILELETSEELEICISKPNENDEIQVVIESENGEEILFTGVPKEIKISKTHNSKGYIELECYSGTANMDMHLQSRSFQGTKMKYDDLLDFIIKQYPKGDWINTGAKGKETGRPIIQYRETDWEFLKRIAASEGTVLTPDITTTASKLWLGLPEAMKKVAVKKEATTRTIRAATLEQVANFYYEIELNDYLKIGDEVNLDGQNLIVTKAFISYKKGVICNTYRIEKPPEMKGYNNDKIKAVSLEGTVIDVSLNHLKIHLDIDPKQSVEEAFWYPCVAEANNVWYTMPHKGERINLNIADNVETGLCMTNTRGTEGEMATTPSMSKPTEKYMETKWDKRLTLHEGDIEFDIPTVNVKMDEDSIYVTANDKIMIESETDINIGKSIFTYYGKTGSITVLTKETKYIDIIAEELLTMKVTKTESVIELDEDNKIHARLYVKMSGSNKGPVPIIFHGIRLSGTRQEQEDILADLQKLTDDELTLNDDGTVEISKRCEDIWAENAKANAIDGGSRPTSGSLNKGTELVRSLAEHNRLTTISIDTTRTSNAASPVNSANASNGTGSDATVSYNPNLNPYGYPALHEDGTVYREEKPNYISLGHELIHASGYTEGNRQTGSSSYTYTDRTGNPVTKTVKDEELQTVGLTGNRSVTENDLLKEHGLLPRGAYTL